MAEETEGVYRCTKCDAENTLDAKYCNGWGSKLRWIYPERTCTHCGHVWRPRKAHPKTCSNCGYNLSRDNIVEIKVSQLEDQGDGGMLETKCSICGKKTRKYTMYRKDKNDPWKDVCYACIGEYFIKKSEEGEDIVEGSFHTFGIERLSDGTEVLKRE